MPPDATRSGSFPAIEAPASERPSPPPSPMPGTPEWFGWATKRIEGHARELAEVRSFVDRLIAQIGRPPIPAANYPGEGMWLVLAGVRSDCTAILARLDAAAEAQKKRAGWAEWAARVVVGAILLGALALLWGYVAGHWHW